MIWWLKSRNAVVIVAATVLTALLGIALRRTVLPLPVLTGIGGRFLLSALVAVMPAVLWLNGTGRTAAGVEAAALRPVHRWDTALAAVLAGTALVVSGSAYLLVDDDIALVVGRNITFYLAAAVLLGACVGPRVAGPCMSGMPIVVGVAGWNGRFPEPWAVILHPGRSAAALVATFVLMAVACGVGVVGSRGWVPAAARRWGRSVVGGSR
ncbi:hypothetical protein ACWEPM_38200 [Streptomyces sp. NPDC004244]